MSALALSLQVGKVRSQSIQDYFYSQGAAFAGIKAAPKRYGHNNYLFRLPYKGSLPSTPFAGSNNNIDFDIKADPSLYLVDNDSMFLELKVQETGGVNPVTPQFAESLLDKNSSWEWLMDTSTQIATPISMLHTVLHPAIELDDDMYSQLCQVLNHNTALSHGSQVAIAASATQIYWIRVPNYFPDKGFWLGALGTRTLSLRVRTQATSAIYSGSGTLGLIDAALVMFCVKIADEEIPQMTNDWANVGWTITESQIHEPTSVTLAASGAMTAPVKLETYRDLQVKLVVMMLHTSKTFTSGADYWSLIELPKTAKAYLTDRSGGQIFTSNQEFYGEMRYLRPVKLFGDSRLMLNVPLIFFAPSPNLASIFHGTASSAEGIYNFTGDEYFQLVDSSFSTAGVFCDSIAFFSSAFHIKNGKLVKVTSV